MLGGDQFLHVLDTADETIWRNLLSLCLVNGNSFKSIVSNSSQLKSLTLRQPHSFDWMALSSAISQGPATSLRKISVSGLLWGGYRAEGFPLFFASLFGKSLVTLDLDGNMLGTGPGASSMVASFARTLQSLSCLRVLSLRRNRFTVSQVKEFLKSLSPMHLKSLHLDHNMHSYAADVNITPELNRLSQLRQLSLCETSGIDFRNWNLPCLHSLYLDTCQIDCDSLKSLCSCFPRLRSLAILSLDENGFRDEGVIHFGQCLSKLVNLKELSMGFNFISLPALQSLCAGFTTLNNLKNLYLYHNSFGFQGIHEILQCLESSAERMESFSLDNNDSSGDVDCLVMQTACRVLPQMTNVRWIRLDSCNLSEETIRSILRCALLLPKLERCRIERHLSQLAGFPDGIEYDCYRQGVYLSDKKMLQFHREHPLFLACGLGDVPWVRQLLSAKCDANFVEPVTP